MKLSVIIVNYNVKHYLEQCLMSLRRSLQGIDAEVIVVDNHSADGSVAYLKERFPETIFIASQHNEGFARANNIALRQSRGEYVLLLNPDTIMGESTLHEALSFMAAHPDGGALGVRMLKSNGENALESRRGLPSPTTAICKMAGLCRLFPRHHKLGHYYMDWLSWDSPHEIEVVSGACCLLRREAIDRVGLLDEDFFMYGEDIDLSFRLLKGGFKNYYFPTPILHYKGESTEKSSFRYVHVFYEAMLIFYRKHYQEASFLLSLPIKTAIYGRALIALVGMLAKSMPTSLGFFPKKSTTSTRYLFLGGEEMLSECRQLAAGIGLEAIYIKGDEQALPEGHLCEQAKDWHGAEKIYAVYDTDNYSYDCIFSLFMSSPMPQVELGTYSIKTHRLITTKEIISKS